MKLSTINFSTWVAPRHLEDDWRPAMFAPELMEWISFIETDENSYAPLSDCCLVSGWRAADDNEANPSDYRWFVDRSGVRQATIADFVSKSRKLSRLPAEAILIVSRFDDSPSVIHWSEEPFRGAGCYDPTQWIVLEPSSRDGIAWLVQEFQEDYVQAQLRRAAIGSYYPTTSVGSLSAIKIRTPDESRRRELASLASRKLISHAQFLRSRRLQKNFFLTGSTLEERLTQFEQFVVDDGLFSRLDFIYVEPANPGNRNSNLFMASARTQVAASRAEDLGLRPVADEEVNTEWREWFWDNSSTEDYRVFNSPLTASELPSFILGLSLVPKGTAGLFDDGGSRVLPAFSLFRDVVLTGDRVSGVEDELESNWASTWADLNTLDRDLINRSVGSDFGGSFVQDLFSWAKQLYRPALVLKVRREGAPIGAYIFFGNENLQESSEAFAQLDDLGFQFVDILSPTSETIEAASRRESLRRLSWLMHQLNGPVGRAGKAFADLTEFLDLNPNTASALVPNEEKATRSAAMLEQLTLSDFTFASRLKVAIKAVSDIRKVSYQIRRLKQVQGELEKKPFDLSSLLGQLSDDVSHRLPNLQVECTLDPVRILGHRETLREAIEEVISNACREIEERHASEPRIRISCDVSETTAEIKIVDNGLPADIEIVVDDPFKEDASGYASTGRGTGLGLAIVRETFRAHGGDCTLIANQEHGIRTAGVTFIATLKL